MPPQQQNPQIQDLINKMNEMQQTVLMLKQENDYLKSINQSINQLNDKNFENNKIKSKFYRLFCIGA